VDEAFREAPDHLTFVTELSKAPTGNIWRFTLREKEWA
jgi:acyl-CoA synthetase (AMP-forming)/AMP-acid ligase II